MPKKQISRKMKLLCVSVILLALVVGVLAACSVEKVTVEEINIVGDGYKKDYIVGETLDISGLKIEVKYTDGELEVFSAKDLADLKVTNFKSDKEAERLQINLNYKGAKTHFFVTVVSQVNSKIQYAVHFNTMGGSEIEDAGITAYTAMQKPEPDPTREGYYFAGWYKEPGYVNSWDFNTDKIVSETTIYAKWGRIFTVHFKYDGEVITQTDIREGEVYLLVPQVPHKDGYAGNWNYNGNWDDLYDGQIIEAVYTKEKYTVKFIFTGNGGTIEYVIGANFEYGDDVNDLAENTLRNMELISRDHYHISGWKLDDPDKPAIYADYAELLESIKGNTFIRALYDPDIQTVTFDFAFDSAEPGYERRVTVEIPYNMRIESGDIPQIPVRDNFKFDKWYGGGGQPWNFNMERVTADVTLHAGWIPQYTLTFYDTDGTTVWAELKVDEHSSLNMGEIPAPPAPDAGYTSAWDRVEFKDITADDEIYVVMTIITYTVRFYYNSTEGQELIQVNGRDEQRITYGGSAVVPSAPSREGYTFYGWSYSSAELDFVAQNMDVMAQYTQNKFVVEFNPLTAEIPITSKEIGYGDRITDTDFPEISRGAKYDFDGWFKDIDCTLPWDKENDVVKSSIMLFAKWTEKFTVTFVYRTSALDDSQKATLTRVVRSGEIIQNAPEIPALTGLVGRWTYNSATINFETFVVRGDLTVEALYSTATYVVEFRSDSKVIFTQVVPHGGKIAVPPDDPEKTGHKFISWGNYSPDTPIERNTSYDAIFEINKYTVRFIVENPLTHAETVVLEYSGDRRINHGSNAPPPVNNPDFTSSGYKFTGWKTGGSENPTMNIVKDTDIYATFAPIDYSVFFITEYNNEIIETQKVLYGECASAAGSPPVRTGYVFDGWDYDFNNPIFDTTIIYALFGPEEYTVRLFGNHGLPTDDGQPTITEQIVYGGRLGVPVEPSVADMAFLGWYTEPTGENKYNFNTPVTGGFDLYAKWEPRVNGSDGVLYEFDSNSKTFSVVGVDDAHGNANVYTIESHQRHTDGAEYPVAALANGAFKNRVNLVSITLPNTITTIGTSAFMGCINLVTIEIPQNVTRIRSEAFADCTSLTSIVFNGTALTSIGDNAFSGARALIQIDLPEGLKTIGIRAFFNCSAMKELIIPENIESIGASAFAGCANLKYAKFMRAVKPALGLNAFDGTEDYFRIYVGNRTQYITTPEGGWAKLVEKGIIYAFTNISYDGKWAYERILTGENVGKIRLIQYLGTDVSVSVGNTLQISEAETLPVAELGSNVFDKHITLLEIGSGLSITEKTFNVMKALEHLVLNIENNFYMEHRYLYDLFAGNPKLAELTVTAKAEYTLRMIFGEAAPTSLKKVNIKEGSTFVPENMFRNNMNITTVTIPSSVTEIGNYAFYGCSSLQYVAFTGVSSLVRIGTEAFLNCEKLALGGMNIGLTIPSTVQQVGVDALKNTKYLNDYSSVTVIIGDQILYKYLDRNRPSDASKEFIIPNTLKVINDYAFYGSSITSVRFDTIYVEAMRLTTIGEHAFENCIYLEYAALPRSVEDIGSRVFYGANKLGKLILFGTTAPALGSDSFVNTMQGFQIFAPFDKSGGTWSMFGDSTFVRIYQPNMTSDGWMFARTSDNAITYSIDIILYFGSEKTVSLGSTFSGTGRETEVAFVRSYAFPKDTTGLILDADLPLSPNTFGALTKIESLTIRNSARISSANKGYFYTLITNNKLVKNEAGETVNSGLKTLSLDGAVDLQTLFNSATLPDYLDTVNILQGATTLVDNMFKGFTHIKYINLPSTMLQSGIGRDAFKGSGFEINFVGDFVYLEELELLLSYKGSDNIVYLPAENITAINQYAFYGNDTVELLFIEDNIINIYYSAFANMSSLIKVFINAAAPSTDGIIFGNNAEGAELFVPSQHLASYAGYSNIAVADGGDVEIIGDSIIKILSQTEAIFLQYIGDGKKAKIPEKVSDYGITALGNNVFLREVTDITISVKSATTPYSFTNLRNVVKLTVDKVKTAGDIEHDMPFGINTILALNTGMTTFAYSGSVSLVADLLGSNVLPAYITKIEILDGAETVADRMLQLCPNIAEIDFPESIEYLGTNAFEDTAWYINEKAFVIVLGKILYKYKGVPENPTTITIPAEVEIINDYAFSKYVNNDWETNMIITTVRFANNSQAEEIRPNAFYRCGKLQIVDIPETLGKISPFAFEETAISRNAEGMLIVAGSTYSTLVHYNGALQSVTIPQRVRYIISGAFEKHAELETVTFQENSALTIIWDDAFKECTSLISINIPDTVTHIGNGAFSGTPWNSVPGSFITTDVGGNQRLVLYKGSALIITFENELANITRISGGAFGSLATTFSVAFLTEVRVSLFAGALDEAEYIYVPLSFESNYKTAWAQYASKIVGCPVVKFDLGYAGAQGTPAPQIFTTGSGYAGEPSEPVRSGYDFLGWYFAGSPWDFNGNITSDMTLTAMWEKI